MYDSLRQLVVEAQQPTGAQHCSSGMRKGAGSTICALMVGADPSHLKWYIYESERNVRLRMYLNTCLSLFCLQEMQQGVNDVLPGSHVWLQYKVCLRMSSCVHPLG